MKLEVGQKIGIYEALSSEYGPPEGTCHVGAVKGKNIIIYRNHLPNKPWAAYKNEVRKVGSLIVKRLKVPEPPKH